MKRAAAGFTLVEALMVVLVLAIAGSAIVSMQGNLFSQQTTLSTSQVQTQLAQECAEQILAVRRFASDGFNTVVSGSSYGTNACGGITALSGYTIPSVTFTDPYSGTGCPTGYSCKLVTISQDGGSTLTLMLVDY
jgi:Tfp pilus assembly protein PilV